jgi:phytoene dehydrogenase-like protein
VIVGQFCTQHIECCVQVGFLEHSITWQCQCHHQQIYDEPQFPKKPLFYANFSSKTDNTLAPEGKEVGFFLIPVAVDLEDNQEIHDEYFDLIMNRIQKNTGIDLREHLIFKKSYLGLNPKRLK